MGRARAAFSAAEHAARRGLDATADAASYVAEGVTEVVHDPQAAARKARTGLSEAADAVVDFSAMVAKEGAAAASSANNRKPLPGGLAH